MGGSQKQQFVPVSRITPDGTDETKQFADLEEFAKKYTTVGAWNENEISAIGSKRTLKTNGELMCEVDDRHEQAAKNGITAFQMHPGPPKKVKLKGKKSKFSTKKNEKTKSRGCRVSQSPDSPFIQDSTAEA